MRLKPVPPAPTDLETLSEAQRALPLVPGPTDDCCARIATRLGIDRKEARVWLTFLRALGLAAEGPSGYRRTRTDLDVDSIADTFGKRVYGASEVLTIVAESDDPLSAAAVFARFAEEVPRWERHRYPDGWEPVWRERVERLLEWATLFGLAERSDGRYRSGRVDRFD